MSRKPEKAVQFYLPNGGGLVNQCCYVSEDELEEKRPEDKAAYLLDRALEGKLSARSLTRYRDTLLREAILRDSAEALACVMPRRRLELEDFSALFQFAEKAQSPDAMAWLLEYRRLRYRPSEFDAYEQRQLDLELGLAEPEEGDLRKLYRLRYLRGGVCICGVRTARRSYEIPASLGGKPVIGVDAGAFYALDPMPRVRRIFPEGESTPGIEAQQGECVLFGRGMPRRGTAETPLSWRVLRREEGKLLLLCQSPAAILAYQRELGEVTWDSCDLRRWLNGIFWNLCFTESERERILPAKVETPDNHNFGTPGGPDTEDRIFLLSAEEAAALPDDGARALGCWWWLRTPGFDNSFAAAVSPEGAVVRIGSFVDTDDYAVRPALWVRTD